MEGENSLAKHIMNAGSDAALDNARKMQSKNIRLRKVI